mmetsp:Transcript_150040/g.482241  ORF Transcript_150040/g.482241 Transcript_150040/m.482241 type:complete len:407 (+) Transcript_150040:70-1290(+)|eukprot:CAMPEP_0203869984 /NCGR_PEP_ID=MMETSP0359-20131031/18003_1 /ASSEMBLY_ACC=CAM_ASM_000338 /TAXON_ID=268821 /ORGANISM="Scrippsiella Hangoei, Strain SHTV-5" /LENGTH=406 /DNA_ID=CAMNT_0050788645 /DNA_START=100 /DNA_END=1320 /DNA_ORIENTATION=-
MALRITGGYTCGVSPDGSGPILSPDGSRPILSQWGNISQTDRRNPRAHIQIAQGYMTAQGHSQDLYGAAFFVVDATRSAERAWCFAGVSKVRSDEAHSVATDVQQDEATENTLSPTIFKYRCRNADGGGGEFSVEIVLHLRRASNHDDALHIELVSAPRDGARPCEQVSEHGVRTWPGALVGTFSTRGRPGLSMHTIITRSLAAVPFDVESQSVCQGRGYVAAAVGAVALAVAAPFAVMGVVGALGFQTGGIVAGSTAAGMMSAEAAAAGGGVAAGGLVATLQSIGAAGLGTAATAGAVTTGAAAGGITAGALGLAANRSQHGKLCDMQGRWTVVIEQWWGRGCRTYLFVSETSARQFFEKKWQHARILVNPYGQEVMSGIFVANLHGALERVRHSWQDTMSGSAA